jgi:hypothetical protein
MTLILLGGAEQGVRTMEAIKHSQHSEVVDKPANVFKLFLEEF